MARYNNRPWSGLADFAVQNVAVQNGGNKRLCLGCNRQSDHTQIPRLDGWSSREKGGHELRACGTPLFPVDGRRHAGRGCRVSACVRLCSLPTMIGSGARRDCAPGARGAGKQTLYAGHQHNKGGLSLCASILMEAGVEERVGCGGGCMNARYSAERTRRDTILICHDIGLGRKAHAERDR